MGENTSIGCKCLQISEPCPSGKPKDVPQKKRTRITMLKIIRVQGERLSPEFQSRDCVLLRTGKRAVRTIICRPQ